MFAIIQLARNLTTKRLYFQGNLGFICIPPSAPADGITPVPATPPPIEEPTF